MSEKTEKRKTASEDAEEVREILSVVSAEVPTLIKSLIASVFSEEAGRNIGKAAAAFYKELKDGGMPENVAVKMTEDYVGVFTSLGDVLRKATDTGKIAISSDKKDELKSELEKRIKERIAEKQREAEEE